MGGQKGIALFYEYLGKKNKVTLLCTSGTIAPPDFPAKILDVLGTSKLRYMNPFLISKLASIIRKEKFSHLIIEHPYFGWLGIILKKLTGIPLILHSHNMEHLRFQYDSQPSKIWVFNYQVRKFFLSDNAGQF